VKSDLTSPATIYDIVLNFKMHGGGRSTPGGMKFVTRCMNVAFLAQMFLTKGGIA
jgi:hypothetical protein